LRSGAALHTVSEKDLVEVVSKSTGKFTQSNQ
jgi:hypothetical protein